MYPHQPIPRRYPGELRCSGKCGSTQWNKEWGQPSKRKRICLSRLRSRAFYFHGCFDMGSGGLWGP
eukprot:9399971-Pyramimonas_sp.AAC.1